jgi:hypothetical protein
MYALEVRNRVAGGSALIFGLIAPLLAFPLNLFSRGKGRWLAITAAAICFIGTYLIGMAGTD